MRSLRLGHSLRSLRPSLTNGPGWRVCLWVQGCSLRCTENCINPHLLPAEGGVVVDGEDLIACIQNVRRSHPQIEGVSILGGEPTDQAEALAPLLGSLRASGLSTMLYSGYVYEALLRSPSTAIHQLLGETDLLVDGPFLSHLYCGELAWRGSRNQRLLCLSDRYSSAELERRHIEQRKAFSFLILPSGLVSVSGIQDAAAAQSIEAAFFAPGERW